MDADKSLAAAIEGREAGRIVRTRDGGPAFPNMGMGQQGTQMFAPADTGMTLRDYFAAAAIPIAVATVDKAGHIIPEEIDTAEFIAKTVYMIADAMLAARNK